MAEAIDQRVEQAVGVRQDHEAVVDLHHRELCVLPVVQPHSKQHRSGQRAREEADREDNDHGHDRKHSFPELGLLTDRPLLQPVHDVDRAVDQDEEGNEDLCEKDDLKNKKMSFYWFDGRN